VTHVGLKKKKGPFRPPLFAYGLIND